MTEPQHNHDEVAGVTIAGPVMINDVATYDSPVETGGPLRCRPGRIALRSNPDRLDSVVVSDPSSHGPGMLRLFDTSRRAAHITYLTHHSDHQGSASCVRCRPHRSNIRSR